MEIEELLAIAYTAKTSKSDTIDTFLTDIKENYKKISEALENDPDHDPNDGWIF